ncbi:unnamed protein product [Bemisia tabaci]|uniref:UDP-glucuronosyltransferase n=1 Tax=Bemisia tabaci TaxID=7038 RepID=A0AAI8UV67_BEMTA|nr:unnamed protein product [Bemisia tabaci]
MRPTWSWVILSLLAIVQGSVGFKALFLFPFPAKSHFGSLSPLAEELARRGHQVTVVTHFPKKNALYKEIIMDSTEFHKQFNDNNVNMTELGTANPLISRAFLYTMFNKFAELSVSAKEMQELISSKEEFDVIAGEVSFFQPSLLAFAHRFQAPFVDLSPATPFTHVSSFMGNPFSFSYIPDSLLTLSDSMSFLERLENTVNGLWDLAWFNWYFVPAQDAIIKKHFKYPGVEKIPSVSELIKNISLSLVNSHFSIGYSRPFSPNMVEIAGMHLKPVQKLPKDLQGFMDAAENGVVYFSLGSVVKEEDIGEGRLLAIADALKRLKQRVIVKVGAAAAKYFEGAKNLHILSWAPQQEILAHPKLLVFITHGGYNSLIEATRAGVPVLGLPVFGDQPRNIRFYETRGIGKGLDLGFTADQFYDSIMHIITTPSYRENAKEISRRTQDRPMSPLDTAVFWVEYVVRHKGAHHLKPVSANLPLYQYALLDIIVVSLLAVFLVYKLICKLYRLLCGTKKTKKEGVIKKTN